MTVIVAARTKTQGIVMACDSQTTSGWLKAERDEAKIWTTDQYLIGAAGCVRTAQLIRYKTDWPKFRPDEDTDVERWLVLSLEPAIRKALKDTGALATENGQTWWNASLLVAWGDHLAEVSGNGCVFVDRTERMAIGSGYAEALGALGEAGPWTRREIVEAARRATVTDIGCSGGIKVGDTKTLEVSAA